MEVRTSLARSLKEVLYSFCAEVNYFSPTALATIVNSSPLLERLDFNLTYQYASFTLSLPSIGALLPKLIPTVSPHVTLHLIEMPNDPVVARRRFFLGFANVGYFREAFALFEELVLGLGYTVVVHIAFGWRQEAQRPTLEQARVREAAWKAAFPVLAERGCLRWDVVPLWSEP